MALILSGSSLMPLGSTAWPINMIKVLLNSHLSLFSVSPASWIQCKTANRFLSCFSWVVLHTNTSSIKHTTPFRPFKSFASFMEVFWGRCGFKRQASKTKPPEWGDENC